MDLLFYERFLLASFDNNRDRMVNDFDRDKYEFRSEFNEKYNLVSRKLLRILSEDGRASITRISNLMGISRDLVSQRLKVIENEFGVRYTPEFNEKAIGFSNRHVIMVKFNSKPDYDEIARLLNESYVPQLAVRIRGTFDMMIYANAPSSWEYVKWDKGMQIALADYDTLWQPSEIAHTQLGFFPLRNELLERATVKEKYRKLLLLLNKNSRSTFQSLSKELGIHFNTVAYMFNSLMRMNYIKRFTISMDMHKDMALMLHAGKYTMSKKFESNAATIRKAYKSDDKFSLVSRYLLCAQLIGSHDFIALGVFDDYDTAYKRQVLLYRDVMAPEKVRVSYGIVEKVLLGTLPIRSVDTNSEYDTVRWDIKR